MHVFRDLRDRINEAVPPRNPLIATESEWCSNTFGSYDEMKPKIMYFILLFTALEQMPSRVTKKGKDSRRKMRELQKQRMLEKKLMFDHFVSTLQSWDENLFDHVTRSQMKAMWEVCVHLVILVRSSINDWIDVCYVNWIHK